MEPFKWGSQFITGIAEVDTQHQSLVSMMNNFGEAIAENKQDNKLFHATLKEVGDYAESHFNLEKKLMHERQLDHRHVKNHLRKHHEFLIDIQNLANTLDGDNAEDCCSFYEYLVNWLAYHVLGTDKNMALQIAAIKNGTSPSDAYLREEQETSSSTEPLLAAVTGLVALVSKRNKALSELNRTLEKRVAERTKELLRSNEQLEKISITDHLTQLPNRRYAINQLDLLWKESLERKLPLSCLMIDADGFKTINDSYGHDAGDVVLQCLAKELQDSVRSDDIVCRLGGDEFLIICPNTNLEGALHLGEQTREKVASLKVEAGTGFWLGSVSIGVACTGPLMKSIDDLIKAADDAVYLAKRDGRNCVRCKNDQ